MKPTISFLTFLISAASASNSFAGQFGEFTPVSVFDAPASTNAIKGNASTYSLDVAAATEGASDRASFELTEADRQELAKKFDRLLSKLMKDGSLLPAVWEAFDREYVQKCKNAAWTDQDIVFAGNGLRSLALYAVKVYKDDPAAAATLIAQINSRLAPLLEEFKPNTPYKTASILSVSSPVVVENDPGYWARYQQKVEEGAAGNLYNIRQSALRSFCIAMKRIKARSPELKDLDARIDEVRDPHLEPQRTP